MSLVATKENAILSADGKLAVYVGPDPTMEGYLAVIPMRLLQTGEWDQAAAWVDVWNPPMSFGVAWNGGPWRTFEQWAERLVNLVEARLAFLEGKVSYPQLNLPDDTPQPASWDKFVEWFKGGFHLDAMGFLAIGSAPAAPPEAIAGLFPFYGPRSFFNRWAYDCGVEADGSPACVATHVSGVRKKAVFHDL